MCWLEEAGRGRTVSNRFSRAGCPIHERALSMAWPIAALMRLPVR